jgi:WD40 repeat protein
VYASQKDPANVTIASRLVSLLASRNFLFPEGAPFQCGSRVLAIRYTKDGRSIYVGTLDGTFRVFDAVSGELSREIHLGKDVRRDGWVFADNDAEFAVCFVDTTIGLFEAKSGQPVVPPLKFYEKINLEPHPGDVLGVLFSPDARWLCITNNSAVWVLNAATAEILAKQSYTLYLFGPVFSSDSARLAFVFHDTVHVLAAPDFKPSFEPIQIKRKGIPDIYLLPHFSPDGRILAVFDPYEGVYLFDPTNGNSLRPMIPNDDKRPNFTDFAPDGRLFGADDKSWELMDPITGKSTSLPVDPGFNGSQTTSANGKLILTASDDGYLRLWETNTARLFAAATVRHSERLQVALSPDGTRVALGTNAGALIRLRAGRGAARPLALRPILGYHSFPVPFFNQKPAHLLWMKEDHAVVLDVASGRKVAGGFAYPPSDLPALHLPNTFILMRRDLKFFVLQDWSGQRPSVIWELTGAGFARVGAFQGDHGCPPAADALPFSPAGDLVARANGFKEIGVWNLHTGAQVGPECSYENENIDFLSIDLSADGKRVASSITDGRVIIWDVATGRVVNVLKAPPEPTFCDVQFSPVESRIFTVSWQKEVSFRNADTGESLSPTLTALSGVDGGDFSTDGRWFYTGGYSGLRIWDGKTGMPVCQLTSGTATQLFSRDGERIAVAFDNKVRIYAVRTGQPLTEPVRVTEAYLTDWSPDGGYLNVFTGSEGSDRKIAILSIPPSLPAGTPIPPWLLQLATICGSKRVNEAGQCVDAPEVVAQIGDVRRQLAALPDDAPYVEWGRWMFDDSATRPIAPGFTITPAEADTLEAEGDQPTTQNEH